MPSLARLSVALGLMVVQRAAAAPTLTMAPESTSAATEVPYSPFEPVSGGALAKRIVVSSSSPIGSKPTTTNVNSVGASPGPTGTPTYIGYWTPVPGAPNPTTPPNLKIISSQFLGNVTPDNSRVSRDLGWHGTINGVGINSYGDASVCQAGATLDDCWDGTNFIGSNMAAFSTNDPLHMHDFSFDAYGRPTQFCNTLNTPAEKANIYFAIGISNVVQVGTNTGIIFTAANNRTFTSDVNLGAGFATVTMNGNTPVCTRTQTNMWAPNEPLYGTAGVIDGGDTYLYAFGQYGTYAQGMLVYLARVKFGQQFTLSAYQYWDQSKQIWTSTRQVNPTPAQAVLQGVPSSQPFWSAYLKKWCMLTRNPVDLWAIDIRTAQFLQGPWSDRQTVYRETNWVPQQLSIYGPSPQTQYDPSGKTLTFTYSIWGNHIQAAKITFA